MKKLLLIFFMVLTLLSGTVSWGPATTEPPQGFITEEPDKLEYGPELEVSGDWVIDNETVVITREQPIHFIQTYHEQHKIIVTNGGCLKIIDSYIRSDFRFPLELYDNSKLIVEKSKLIWEDRGAVITNLDNSLVQAIDSQLDFVGIASGNRPPSYTTVELSNCSIRQLELDLFDLESIIVEGIGVGYIEDWSIASERFQMTLKEVEVIDEVTSWLGNVDATFTNCNLGQVSPDKGSVINLENSRIRELAPRVSGYSGVISGLPRGHIPFFHFSLPLPISLSINIVDSVIENGWYFKYDSESNIEFRNCHFSVLRPSGKNNAFVYDSTVMELWIWDTSGEIRFHNSPIGWIGNIMNYPGQKNDILLSGSISVEDKDWRKRPYHWGKTVIRREFFLTSNVESGDCVIMDEGGTVVDRFILGTSAIRKVLVFDRGDRHFNIYIDGTYRETLELSSDSNVLL